MALGLTLFVLSPGLPRQSLLTLPAVSSGVYFHISQGHVPTVIFADQR